MYLSVRYASIKSRLRELVDDKSQICIPFSPGQKELPGEIRRMLKAFSVSRVKIKEAIITSQCDVFRPCVFLEIDAARRASFSSAQIVSEVSIGSNLFMFLLDFRNFIVLTSTGESFRFRPRVCHLRGVLEPFAIRERSPR